MWCKVKDKLSMKLSVHDHNDVKAKIPVKTAIFEKSKFTFLWKYPACGLKIEISGYPRKLPILTYTPYEYEVNRTKTYEMRAKPLCVFFFPHLTVFKNPWKWSFSTKIMDTFFSQKFLPPQNILNTSKKNSESIKRWKTFSFFESCQLNQNWRKYQSS